MGRRTTQIKVGVGCVAVAVAVGVGVGVAGDVGVCSCLLLYAMRQLERVVE